MKRISSPNGSQVNFESTVDNIQQKAYENLLNRLNMLIEQMGISLQVTNGVSTDELKASLIDLGANISVQPGKALASSGEYLTIANTQTIPNPVGSGDNSGYGIVLTYKEIGSDPVKALNAFVYDKLGGQSLSRKTNYNDSYELSTEVITSTLTALKDSLNSNQVLLAVVWRNTGTFTGPTGYSEVQVNDYTIADLRSDTRMVLSSNLLNADTILFRDRPSVGDNAFGFNFEFSQNLYFNNIEPSDGGTGTLSANQLIMTDGNLKKTNISGTTSQDFWVGVDPNEGVTPTGKKLVVSDGALSNPSELRVHGISGTKDKDEHYSLVTFRWNWDHLRVDSAPGSLELGGASVTVAENTYENMVIDDPSNPGTDITVPRPADISSGVVGKKLLFTSSNNSYTITARSGNELFIQGEVVSGDTVSEAEPLRIVDSNAKQYVFTVKDTVNEEAQILLLDASYVKKPQISLRLPIGENFNFSIQAMNNAGLSNTTAGTTFENQIGDWLDPGTMTLSSDAQGFIIETTGWEEAHELEVIYSSKADLTESTNPFNDLQSGDIERVVMRSNRVHVSSGRPSRFSVALRPIINKQPVGDVVYGNVTSGGGGLLPEEQTIIQVPFDIKVIVGEVTEDRTDPDEFEIEWRDPTGIHPILVDDTFLDGRRFSRVDGSGVPIDSTGVYRINEVQSRTSLINGRKIIRVDNGTDLTIANPIKTGVTKEDRFIVERPLSFDYIITGIHVKLKSIKDVSTNNGAIIRVYQKDRENLAAKMEIEGFSEGTLTQTVNLPVYQTSGGNVIVVADAFDDDDSGSANNEASLAGTLTIVGKPRIVDNF